MDEVECLWKTWWNGHYLSLDLGPRIALKLVCLILGVQQLSHVTLSKSLLYSAWLSSLAKQGSECLSWRVWVCSKQNYMKDLVFEQSTQSKVLGFLPSLASVFAMLLTLWTYYCLIISLIVFQNKTVFTFVPLWGQQWYWNTILQTWSVTLSFFIFVWKCSFVIELPYSLKKKESQRMNDYFPEDR